MKLDTVYWIVNQLLQDATWNKEKYEDMTSSDEEVRDAIREFIAQSTGRMETASYILKLLNKVE
jgi:hypothetical protein